MEAAKPNILLLYTGGTIGMMKDPDTGSLKPFNFNHLLKRIPELKLLSCQIETKSLAQPIDSSNMNLSTWSEIATLVENHYDFYDGFVILHGSDTMSYTASALSFMMENLAKPIIITGSQLPIGDLRTDAKENMITAIQMAALQFYGKPMIKEVGLYFEYKLYRGNRTTKVSAEHFKAFASPNYPVLAESGVNLEIHKENLFRPNPRKSFVVHKKLNPNIALIKLFPGITESIFSSILNTESLQGVVLETYGAGNMSTERWVLQLLSQTVKKGIPVINVTQCSGGRVVMGQYETSENLKRIGLISGNDMTTEAAVCKLMYMLGQEVSRKSFKTLFETSLRGEMS